MAYVCGRVSVHSHGTAGWVYERVVGRESAVRVCVGGRCKCGWKRRTRLGYPTLRGGLVRKDSGVSVGTGEGAGTRVPWKTRWAEGPSAGLRSLRTGEPSGTVSDSRTQELSDLQVCPDTAVLEEGQRHPHRSTRIGTPPGPLARHRPPEVRGCGTRPLSTDDDPSRPRRAGTPGP